MVMISSEEMLSCTLCAYLHAVKGKLRCRRHPTKHLSKKFPMEITQCLEFIYIFDADRESVRKAREYVPDKKEA